MATRPMLGINDLCVENVQRPFVVGRGQVRAAAYPDEPTTIAYELTYRLAALFAKVISLSAAAAAVTGEITDPAQFLN